MTPSEIIPAIVVAVILGLSLLLTIGCGGDVKTNMAAELFNYYPLEKISYWSYNWTSPKGDVWRGSMAVTDRVEDQDLRILVTLDSSIIYNLIEVSKSGYVWDQEGLKHLYRVSASGDSTGFSPPRIVLPATIAQGSVITSSYRYEVFGQDHSLRYGADVRQQQKLLGIDTVQVNGKIYDDCLSIETVWSDTYADGNTQTRRKIVWYKEGVGPVKIVSGIPPASNQMNGDAKGLLGDWN